MESFILIKLDNQLEKLIKDQITKQKLVRTGAMRDSIKVKSYYTGKDIAIEIDSIDYFEHVNNKYKVMENVTNNREWNIVIEQAVFSLLELSIDKKIQNIN